ncbi:hypothetical protein PHYSODRAFT_491702 [Phytophthora sojae]|uniref:Uncharacterized protein n=1 Tax=Phytophthora sojae (strain P6497) TaxID=1094619 RepID=G4Z5S7_PHYSP|nr:hypothetical protein PHYSODRAFT_491702 [Phytophthora sojae]EGZ19510.1 hypothetical protein PHYSODRAFT_491702 [Phytophthora sojae]|eukprot:XP_009522227.1 hypothetical protein PHYSODRAFT_491702 [Phytophthora sojae]
MIPKQVVLTVDVFDSFYLATFMQRLAPTTLAVVMLVDVAESVIELRDLHHKTTKILARINEAPTSKSIERNRTNVLEAVRILLRNMDAQQVQMSADCRVRSCISHPKLSTESNALLGVLDRSLQARSSVIPNRSEHPTPHFSSVLPLPGRIATDKWAERAKTGKAGKDASATTDLDKIPRRSSVTTTATVLEESAEILFTSECIVLTEYVEIIIPIIYGLFILVTVHLPSATYHSEMDGVSVDNVSGMVSRMFLHALLEVLSLVALVVITKRNCGIHVLYQLAFVLETEIAFVPSKLVLWILYALTYRVTHFGTLLRNAWSYTLVFYTF